MNVPSPLLWYRTFGHAVVVVGMAIGAIAWLLLAAVAVGLKAPLHVARDEQIELAVVVVVEEPRARAPPASRDTPARLGHVGERAVAVVVIQRVAAVIRHVEIFEAVVVVVAHRDAHAVLVLRHAGESRLLRDIDERAVRSLVVQPVPECRVGLVRQLARGHRVVEPGAVRQEDVQPAVVVVVQQRHAAAHRLDQVLVRRRGVLVREGDPGCLRGVDEPHVRTFDAPAAAADEARGSSQRQYASRMARVGLTPGFRLTTMPLVS